MVNLVKFLGIFIAIFGAAFLFNPDILKHYMSFWKRGKRLYWGGGLAFLISIILLLAASQCRVSWFIALFGILSLMKGIALLVVKVEKIISMLEWWDKRPDAFLRAYALFAIAIGIALIFCA